MATKQNEPWTNEDDRRLMEMRAAGRSIRSLAAALKRSAGAIAGRISILRSRGGAEAKASPAESEDNAVSPQYEGPNR
jgi:hypothetical protein